MKISDEQRARWREYIERYSMPVPFSGCWFWLRSVGTHGYGATRYPGSPGGASMTTAPRLAFIAWNGPLLKGEEPRHTCHVKLCCNPDHLIRGSRFDNMMDSAKIGALARVLTPSIVRRIRELARAGQAKRAIARELGVGRKNIQNILAGKSWAHLDGAP